MDCTTISIIINFHRNNMLLGWRPPELSVSCLCLLCIAAAFSVEMTFTTARQAWSEDTEWLDHMWQYCGEGTLRVSQCGWRGRQEGEMMERTKKREEGGGGDLETLREKTSRRPREVRKNWVGCCSLLTHSIWRNTYRNFFSSPTMIENKRKCFFMRNKWRLHPAPAEQQRERVSWRWDQERLQEWDWECTQV